MAAGVAPRDVSLNKHSKTLSLTLDIEVVGWLCSLCSSTSTVLRVAKFGNGLSEVEFAEFLQITT
jgi:hypothetical protein